MGETTMGLLDQVIGGVLGQVLGGGRHERSGEGGGPGGGMGQLSPIVQALLMLLMSKGAGGLGDLLGGGGPRPHREAPPAGGEYDGDEGGFAQDEGGGSRNRREGDFGDLAGMLDGPGDRNDGRGPGAGPYARLDHEAGDGQSGLDGLIDRFQRGGLGDLMESWVGHGENRPVQPRQLSDALGSDTVDALAQRTGLPREDLLSQLAEALPQVIDRLTPQGRRPTGEETRGW
jgi:uncharacterized protein YidB (DUF937 family)